MNEDYLWDKTGEPDPEIQKLEEILGALRYQPKPLELPQELLTPRQQRNHFPLLAIAATVLLALIAGGVWLRLRTQSESQPHHAAAPQPVNDKTVVANNNSEGNKEPEKEQVRKGGLPNKEQVRKGGLPPLSQDQFALAKHEREEALAAKQQVMLALRLTTEKLSLVHKKTQTPASNQIKNQHRVG